MTQQSLPSANPSRVMRWGKRWSQFVTVTILVNLLLVFFNLTYVPLRPLYLRYMPDLTRLYDPVKGIEPHPVTQTYLASIEELRSRITENGLDDAETQTVLADLREQSVTLVEENPFQGDRQASTFARLKRRMRDSTEATSAQAAFDQLWRADYIRQNSWSEVDAFLQADIEPLLAQTYYRETLPTGDPIDDFWRIDLIFIIFFGSELVVRALVISRRTPGINGLDAIARRWYELPLILPFWRWLRVIPAAIRLHRTQLLDVERLLGQATHEPAAYLSDRVSKYIIIRLLNQTQDFVREGALLSVWQKHPNHRTIGESKKLDQITDRLVRLVVIRVLPTVKPDLEALLRHNLHQALADSQLYGSVSQIPGLSNLPDEALDGIADYLSQATCDALTSSYTDQEGRVLLEQLSKDFRYALGNELSAKAESEELKRLITDLLEELKVNYVERSRQDDPEATLREVDQIDQVAQTGNGVANNA